MATRYRHRIGVRAEICFDMILDTRNPLSNELCRLVTDLLRQAADSDGAVKLSSLPGGAVYPEWNSVDPELEPDNLLDPSTIRTFDCVEIDTLQ